jgi:hypothetical protein
MATITQTANLFELRGDVRVTYSTTSFTGKAQLTYSGPEGKLSFTGDEIRSASTALGTEVTVVLDSAPDLHTITFTLLLPAIKLGSDREAKFQTVAIKTTNHTTIAGPPVGPEQTYETLELRGVAQSVAF